MVSDIYMATGQTSLRKRLSCLIADKIQGYARTTGRNKPTDFDESGHYDA